MRAGPDENGDITSVRTAAWTPLGEGAFHARLMASRGVWVVLFHAPHCSACRLWKQVLPEALSDLASAFVEVDVAEATGLARYFGIFHLPSIYLYRDGVFHAELQCEAHRERIRETAVALLAAPAQDEPD